MCVEQEELSSPDISPDGDQPLVIVQPTSTVSVPTSAGQAGERTALAGGASVPSAYRTDYTMS